ncbi:DUF2523 family protein [Undibacterium danionis]|uniref:DUF2523 family protein n=1 Tax=Undibacterium danionis TaxID=1812100 RepID=A0ABV6IET4_9BURK
MPAALFGILLSALRTMFGFLLRSVIVKFVTFFALYFIVKEFMEVIIGWGLIPSGKASQIHSAIGGISASVWYFLDLFAVSSGISMVISAYSTRFIIRRVPLIG